MLLHAPEEENTYNELLYLRTGRTSVHKRRDSVIFKDNNIKF
jgi:hypothetical protein